MPIEMLSDAVTEQEQISSIAMQKAQNCDVLVGVIQQFLNPSIAQGLFKHAGCLHLVPSKMGLGETQDTRQGKRARWMDHVNVSGYCLQDEEPMVDFPCSMEPSGDTHQETA